MGNLEVALLWWIATTFLGKRQKAEKQVMQWERMDALQSERDSNRMDIADVVPSHREVGSLHWLSRLLSSIMLLATSSELI